MLRKTLFALGIVVVIILAGVGFFYFEYVQPLMKKMMTVKTVPFDKNLTLVLGGGGNSGILSSDSMVLVIDTKMDKAANDLYDSVKKIAGNKPIIVVNTHIHSDHTKGNSLYKGQTIIAGGNYDKEAWVKEDGAEGEPSKWVKDSMVLKVGDETVTILNLGRSAHTQSDVMVYLHNRKMIFTGDVVLNKQAPALFKRYDSSSDGYMWAFDFLPKRFDIKTVVPGHGDIGGLEIIDTFRQYFKDMQTAAADPSKCDEICDKYKDWGHVPFFMSPGATISYIKGKKSDLSRQ